MKRLLSILALIIALAGVLTIKAHAQDRTPSDDEVNAIAKKLYCPVCESTPLDVCPTEACRDWREQIRTMLSEGRTEDEILKEFEKQYGARVLAEPPASGLNWLVYLIPPVFILAGAFILFRSMRDWTKPKETESTPVKERSGKKSAAQDDYVARLEEELKKRK